MWIPCQIKPPRTKPTDPVLRIRCEYHRELGSISELGNLLSICMGLPKKELKKFSGNPMDYWGFIRSFMSNVDRYTDGFANRLSYLIQCCDGEALDAIKGCTVLEPESGYNEAISILQRRFGQPYVIARCYIRSLTEGCTLKQDDAKGLTDLVEKMKMCATTLRQLPYESDMNSCRTLGDIVRRLPTPMQPEWFELATAILRHGGFRLTKFYSSLKGALNDIPMEDLSSVTVNLDRQQTVVQKALGVVWDGQSDNIRFKVSGWQGQATRRTILSYVASPFDPLGLVAPVLLTAKRLLQELCRRKADWDEALASEETVAWEEWPHSLTGLTELRIPRCTKPQTLEVPYQMELHGFSDASEAGYGAAIYASHVTADVVKIRSQLATIKSSDFPGPEAIHPVACKHGGDDIPLLLLITCALSLTLGSVPP
ncbi:hypothetical protein EG68_04762 [Paragonimus skrjabini miyazakii]|uniref:Uncharacterized protein n=1 Tax=Paragonimus skrjabini miyazakii TaxID=59628 RepID=A0A8S9YYQ6_9TREM|nr:hypothetical protein EG68_04762 [Paragonimus skrjabini miyazakii]